MLDQREESLLNQIRGIRFAPAKTNSKLVKRSVKTVDNRRQVRNSDEFVFLLINRLFVRNHFAPALFLDESLSSAKTLQKTASLRFSRRNAVDAKKAIQALATASDRQ